MFRGRSPRAEAGGVDAMRENGDGRKRNRLTLDALAIYEDDGEILTVTVNPPKDRKPGLFEEITN